MSEIKSDKAIVQQVADKLYQSLEPLSNQESVDYAHQTTLAGNANAKNTITTTEQLADDFLTTMQEDIEKIEHTGVEFTIKDDEIAIGINTSSEMVRK